jgi:hypothetical protein
MNPMTIGERWAEFKRSWHDNRAMRCPSCRGTGEPGHHVYRETVYWRGRPVDVCHNCEGRGVV